MNVLELLSSASRCELAGDRLTSYGMEVGGGSLNWWDGRWDNDELDIPYQLENIFANRDGQVALCDGHGVPIVARAYYNRWRPDRLDTRFVIPRYGWMEQLRWIDDDVACVKLRFRHSNRRPLPLRLMWEGERRPREEVRWQGNCASLRRTAGRLANVWRVFAFEMGPGARPVVTKGSRGLRLDFAVPPEGCEVSLYWSFGGNRNETIRRLSRARADRDGSLARTEKGWRRFFEQQVPGIDGLPLWLTKQYYHLFYVHRVNTYPPIGGCLRRAFTCPSKFRLLPQWFWDTAFHSIVEKWLHPFPAATEGILNILDSAKEDGQLPHTLDRRGFTFDSAMGFPMVQPFVLPMATWDLFLAHGGISWLRKTLPGLVAFDRWLKANRSGRDGLIYIRSSGETGWDNSVRWKIDNRNRHAVGTSGPEGTIPADFNACILIGRRVMAAMAEVLGRRRLAGELRTEAAGMGRALRRLWDERMGLFADRLPDGRLSGVASPGGMIPLLAGIADRRQARRIHSSLTDPRRFWTRYPVPTLSLTDPRYSDVEDYGSYANGRTWCHINWMVTEGLMRYGFRNTARELIRRTLDMVSAGGEPLCVESYHPRHFHRYQPYNNSFCYGWSALPNDMLLRRVLGVQARMDAGALSLDPLWMDGLQEVALRGLRLGGRRLDLDYRRTGKRVDVRIRNAGLKPLAIVSGGETKMLRGRETRVRVSLSAAGPDHWTEG